MFGGNTYSIFLILLPNARAYAVAPIHENCRWLWHYISAVSDVRMCFGCGQHYVSVFNVGRTVAQKFLLQLKNTLQHPFYIYIPHCRSVDWTLKRCTM